MDWVAIVSLINVLISLLHFVKTCLNDIQNLVVEERRVLDEIRHQGMGEDMEEKHQ